MTYTIYYIIIFLFNGLLWSKSSIDIQKEIDTNNRTLKNLENSIIQLEKDIKSIENSEKNLEDHIEILNQKIEYRNKQIAILIQQDKRISELISNSKKMIKEKENELNELKQQLTKRSLYLYKYGKDNLISKTIISDDWNRILNRLKYLKILLKHEKKLNDNIKNKITELKIDQDNLKKEQKKQKDILKDAKSVQKNLENDKKSKNKKIKRIKDDKISLTENLDSKKKEISEMEQLIKKLITDINTAKNKEDELARKRSNQNKATSGNFAQMKGKLNWPASGKIITKFGFQKNVNLNTLTENIGINIQTNRNAPVYSVLDGFVSVITYLRNYGNTIIINHGGGFYTVYANVENILVKENEYIGSNYQIASVSKSENPAISNSYFLHFEIWNNETKLNPELWIKK